MLHIRLYSYCVNATEMTCHDVETFTFVYRLLKFKNNEYRFYFKIYCGFNVSYMDTSLFAVKNKILLTKFFFYFCILFKFFCLNICAKIYCKISLPYHNSQLLKMKHGNIMFSYFKF